MNHDHVIGNGVPEHEIEAGGELVVLMKRARARSRLVLTANCIRGYQRPVAALLTILGVNQSPSNPLTPLTP